METRWICNADFYMGDIKSQVAWDDFKMISFYTFPFTIKISDEIHAKHKLMRMKLNCTTIISVNKQLWHSKRNKICVKRWTKLFQYVQLVINAPPRPCYELQISLVNSNFEPFNQFWANVTLF